MYISIGQTAWKQTDSPSTVSLKHLLSIIQDSCSLRSIQNSIHTWTWMEFYREIDDYSSLCCLHGVYIGCMLLRKYTQQSEQQRNKKKTTKTKYLVNVFLNWTVFRNNNNNNKSKYKQCTARNAFTVCICSCLQWYFVAFDFVCACAKFGVEFFFPVFIG